MRQRTLFLFAFLLASSSALAQITGTAMTVDGAPLAGVVVRAYDQESSEELIARLRSTAPERKALAETTSDERGRFQLRVQGRDVVDLAFSATGRAPAALTVVTKGDVGAVPLKTAALLS